MSFEKENEEELSKMAKHSGIKFWFYYGYIIDHADVFGGDLGGCF